MLWYVTEASCDHQRNLKIIRAVFAVKWSRTEDWDYIEWAVLPGRCSTLWGSPSPARISLVLLPQQSLPCLSWRAGWSYTGCLASGCLRIFATFLLQKHTAHVGGCTSGRFFSSHVLDMTRAETNNDKYYNKTLEKQVSVSYFYAGGKNICVCVCVSRKAKELSRSVPWEELILNKTFCMKNLVISITARRLAQLWVCGQCWNCSLDGPSVCLAE